MLFVPFTYLEPGGSYGRSKFWSFMPGCTIVLGISASSTSLLAEAGHREVEATSLNLGEISHSSSTSRGTSETVVRLEV